MEFHHPATRGRRLLIVQRSAHMIMVTWSEFKAGLRRKGYLSFYTESRRKQLASPSTSICLHLLPACYQRSIL